MFDQIVILSGWILNLIILAGYLLVVQSSLKENRFRPLLVSSLLAIPLISLLTVLLLFPFDAKVLFFSLVLSVFLLLLAGVTIPFGKNPVLKIIGKQEKLDERDALFHRFYTLHPGMPEFDEFYDSNPDLRNDDNEIRRLPRFEEAGSRSYHPLSSLYQKALFDQIEFLSSGIETPPASQAQEVSTEEITRRLKGFSRYLGASLVGTTRLNPNYIYSHVARDADHWGEPIALNHKYALVFAVEMSHKMVRHAPWSEVITESAFQYLEAARIATAVSRYIQLLGYDARAHIDQNYRVMCVPIAVDAGLGELGRLGLLITPEFGPRVRLSVVTTELRLLQDQPVHFGVQDFCEICKKCAVNCPSRSIDFGEKKVYRGVEKWQSRMENCFRFWRQQGSDCSICLKVCPYSHPDSLLHNLVRGAVRKNPLARRLALWGDDLFYGRKPENEYSQEEWHKRV